MINTLSIKIQQNQKGFFTTGSGPEVVLIQGSCRVAPYLQYLDVWNRTVGNNRFTIHSLDPFNLSFDPITDALVDRDGAIEKMEKHEGLLQMLSTVGGFIHEHYESFGMFNTSKEHGKSIYDFGMNPKIDMTVPNFHDVFVLASDFYTFDKEFRSAADDSYRAYGKLIPTLQAYVRDRAYENLAKFYEVCKKSDFPEMAIIMQSTMKSLRYFWSFNHVSKWFTLPIFDSIIKRLSMDTPEEFCAEIEKEDMFSTVFTPLTDVDREVFGFNWSEKVVFFKEYNKIAV